MLYDGERDTAYVVNRGLGSLQRFAFSGGSWSLASTSISVDSALGLSPNGTELLLLSQTAAGGVARLLDPNSSSFAEIARVNYPYGLQPPTAPISVTNDGRAWFGIDLFSAAGFEFGYFDFARRAFVGATLPDSLQRSVRGPSFVVARDGERLVMNQNNCCTPRPPVLYLDASESVWRANPGTFDGFTRTSASDDGIRIVYDSVVLDRDFGQIGTLPTVAPNWFVVSSLMRPDGQQTYLLAYNEGDISNFGPPQLPPTNKPRVYVFDSSTRQPTQAELPSLGYFELNDFPTCREWRACSISPASAVSTDGRTLFFAGSARFLVVPIPAESTLAGAPRLKAAPRSLGKGATVRWHLDLN
jgi:hypothetical protein